MATKRSAELIDLTSNKRLKCDVPDQLLSEAHEKLELFGKQYQQKQIEFENQQEKKDAEIEHHMAWSAQQSSKTKEMEAQLTNEKTQRREDAHEHEAQKQAAAKKLVESERKGAAQIRSLEERLHQANRSKDGKQETDRLGNLERALSIREKGLEKKTALYEKQIQALQNSAKSQTDLKQKSLDLEREILRLKKQKAVLEQKSNDVADCLLKALSALSKIKEVTKGMQFANMGIFGVAFWNWGLVGYQRRA